MKRLLRPADLTSEFNIPRSTAALMRRQGDGPPWFRQGRSVFYRAEDVEAWIASRIGRGGQERSAAQDGCDVE